MYRNVEMKVMEVEVGCDYVNSKNKLKTIK